ncbi:MAG: arylamine N-acetyltransferase [Deinococcota bacterium]
MNEVLPTDQLLAHLELDSEPPSYDYLRRLMLAYRERVPYENASRLLRYRDIRNPDARVRLPQHVWQESMSIGSGASCSDGTYAFKKLLDALGFEVKLVINSEGKVQRDKADQVLDFPREPAHCSILAHVEGQRYVVEACSVNIVKVPLPIGLPYRVDVTGHTDEGQAFHYAAEPLGDNYFELHNIGPDGFKFIAGEPLVGSPKRGQMYIFSSRPVSDADFEDYMRWAYHKGYSSQHLSFVCRHPDSKVEHRFSTFSGRLWRNDTGSWEQMALGQDVAATLAEVSGLPYERLKGGLEYLETKQKVSPK